MPRTPAADKESPRHPWPADERVGVRRGEGTEEHLRRPASAKFVRFSSGQGGAGDVRGRSPRHTGRHGAASGGQLAVPLPGRQGGGADAAGGAGGGGVLVAGGCAAAVPLAGPAPVGAARRGGGAG